MLEGWHGGTYFYLGRLMDFGCFNADVAKKILQKPLAETA